MKKDRFLWSAHRITERQKAGKARSIKGKQLKNSRNTDYSLSSFSLFFWFLISFTITCAAPTITPVSTIIAP